MNIQHFINYLNKQKKWNIEGTNGDRCLRQKQGAVSGAALRFSQGSAADRSENRLSARGFRL